MLALLLFVALGYRFFSPRRSPAPPNIVLISLDTLRADSVGAYQPTADSVTPSLDALASDSILYRQAYAPIPFTLSSHMSLFSGVYPGVHAVIETPINPEQSGGKILPASITTLPQLLRGHGYRTLGLFSNAWLKAGFGFGRGFDHYQQLAPVLTLAASITDQAIDLIDRQTGPAPFFLFLHYYDAHSDFWNEHPPYGAPGPFQIKGYREAATHFCVSAERCATQFLLETNAQQRQLNKGETALLKDLYRGGVNYTDHEVGRLLDELKKRKMYDAALIIITSDHGEEMQEHGELLHGQTYEECVRVPLLIKLPYSDGHGTVVDEIAELIDILPTLLAFLQKPFPAQLQGKSLLPSTLKSRQQPSLPLIRHTSNKEMYATRDRRYKLLFNTASKQALLFDLLQDPGETVDIAKANPEVVEQLAASIAQQISINQSLAKGYATAPPGSAPTLLGEDEKARLKSLGYTK